MKKYKQIRLFRNNYDIINYILRLSNIFENCEEAIEFLKNENVCLIEKINDDYILTFLDFNLNKYIFRNNYTYKYFKIIEAK